MPISPLNYSPISKIVPQSYDKSQDRLSFGKLQEEDKFRKDLAESEDFTGKEKKKTLEILEGLKKLLEDPKFDKVYSAFYLDKPNEINCKDEDTILYAVVKGDIDPENGKLGFHEDAEVNTITLTDDAINPKTGDEVFNVVRNLERFTRSRGIDTPDEKLALSQEKAISDAMRMDDLPPSQWPKDPEPFDPQSNPFYLDCWLP